VNSRRRKVDVLFIAKSGTADVATAQRSELLLLAVWFNDENTVKRRLSELINDKSDSDNFIKFLSTNINKALTIYCTIIKVKLSLCLTN
jgi:hypothetical protein